MLTSFCLASDSQRKTSISHAGQFEKDRIQTGSSSRTFRPEAAGAGGKVQSKNYTGWNANSYIHTYPIPSLCRIASKIRVKCKFVVFPRPFSVLVSLVYVVPFNPVTVLKEPITIVIIVTFMFHSFFQFLSKVKVLILFSLSFSFILWSAGTARSTILQILFFYWLF